MTKTDHAWNIIKDTSKNKATTNLLLICLLLVFGSMLMYFLFNAGFDCIKSPIHYGVKQLADDKMVDDASCNCQITNMEDAGGHYKFHVTPKDGVKAGHLYGDVINPLKPFTLQSFMGQVQ